MRNGVDSSDSPNAFAAPVNDARIVGGGSKFAVAFSIAEIASPSETSGAVSNESVTDGN